MPALFRVIPLHTPPPQSHGIPPTEGHAITSFWGKYGPPRGVSPPPPLAYILAPIFSHHVLAPNW